LEEKEPMRDLFPAPTASAQNLMIEIDRVLEKCHKLVNGLIFSYTFTTISIIKNGRKNSTKLLF
jgi:hypothetical protein